MIFNDVRNRPYDMKKKYLKVFNVGTGLVTVLALALRTMDRSQPKAYSTQ